MPTPKLIHELLPELRAQRDLSPAKLSLRSGIQQKTIEAIEHNPGRVSEVEIYEALAQGLGVQPTVFYEYPIAVARAVTKQASEADERLDEDGPASE